MTVVNFNYPKFKYTIASTGQPGAGYKLFTYEEGTSTKQTTWTSLAKTAANTNPIILDANGEADVWLDGNYKFVLAPPTDTDPPASPIWTVDAIRSSDTTAATPVVTYPINGSFETDTDGDGTPDSWTLSTLSGGTIAIDSSSQSHGANSLKFTSSGSGAGSSSSEDYYEVEPSKNIGIKFSIISANANTHNTVEIYWYNSAKTFLSSSSVYDDSGTNPTSWTRKYFNTTSPATARYARIILTGVAADSATHSSTNFDNIVLDTGFIGEITASLSELNTLDGITATTDELNYVDGVTSNIQTQLDFQATTAAIGRVELATDAEVQTGTDTGRVVTPSGLASFDKSLVNDGYMKLPGGVIIQWGEETVPATATTTFSFPLTWPTAALNMQVSYSSTANAKGDPLSIDPISTTQFNIRSTIGAAETAFWVAVGH